MGSPTRKAGKNEEPAQSLLFSPHSPAEPPLAATQPAESIAGPSTAPRLPKPTRKVSDLVKHYESRAKSPEPQESPKPRRATLPAPRPPPLEKSHAASALVIRKNVAADQVLQSPRGDQLEEQRRNLSSAPPPPSPPLIQKGNLSDMDWTEREVRHCDIGAVAASKSPAPALPPSKQHLPDMSPSERPSTRLVNSATSVRPSNTPRVNPLAVKLVPPAIIEEHRTSVRPVRAPQIRQSPHNSPTGKIDGLPEVQSGLPFATTPWKKSELAPASSRTDSRLPSRLVQSYNYPSSQPTKVDKPFVTVDVIDYASASKEDDDDIVGTSSPDTDTVPILASTWHRRGGEDQPQPIPAKQVFSRNSLPLHLPALDSHLSDRSLFPSPKFTPSELICSEVERELFRLLEADDTQHCHEGHALSRVEKYSAAGRQLSVPVEEVSGAAKGSQGARRRRHRAGNRAGQQDEEVMMSSPSSRKPLLPDEQTRGETGATTSGQSTAYLPSFSDTTTVDSTASTDSHPVTRVKMFPPLMLLRTNTLKELKSNAVGPRAPRKGFLGALPGVNSLLGSILDTLLGLEGSSFASSLFRLEILRDFAQIMQANLTFREQLHPATTKVEKFFFFTVPSILAFDFVSLFGAAVIWLLVWMGITAAGLAWFWRLSSSHDPNRDVQGYEGQPYIFRSAKRGSKALNVFITFVLTSLYMPLSKVAVDALLWSSDYWQVEDPYQGGTVQNPIVKPLGDPNTYRDPLDFCYTTTMKRDEFNFAYLIIPAAALTVLVYTIWWPIYLAKVIRTMRPRVSKYNELGVKRSPAEMDREYQRLLGHDKSPLNYLYNGYNRRFSAYKPFYLMCFKLSTLLVLSFFTQQNCIWKQQPAPRVVVIQQSALIGLQVVLLVMHIFTKPFVDIISNRSELVGRATYVFTAVIGLLVALRVKGSTVYKSVILWIIQGLSYTFSLYFTVVSTNLVSHTIKRLQKRLDFSIDIYSPLLDFDKHIKRRVWEETLSIILLTGKDYRMPVESVISFSASENWPPYLLFFRGTPAERHVENLMILKEIGLEEYKSQVRTMASHEGRRVKEVLSTIQKHFAGPDAYFRPACPPYPEGVTSFFGKAFVVPFPPTVVIRYDQQEQESITLTTLVEFQVFVEQNMSFEVQEKKRVRLNLRAMDGQKIRCPYRVECGRITQSSTLRRGTGGLSLRRRYGGKTFSVPVIYSEGVLSIRIKEFLPWETYNFASGFDVFVTFTHGQRLDPAGPTWIRNEVTIPAAEAFGLHDSFALTPELIRLFHQNDDLIRWRLPEITSLLNRYRNHFYNEAQEKQNVLTYSFLAEVFDNSHLPHTSLSKAFKISSNSLSVQNLPQRYPACIASLYQRLSHIRRTEVHSYWYLFWDDLWRQNGQDYKILRCHQRSNLKYFDPRFPSSIAYRPMERCQLETFLFKRGIWTRGKNGNILQGVIHTGLLNRLYFCINRIVFAPNVCHDERGWSSNEVPIGVSKSPNPNHLKDIKPFHPVENHVHENTQQSPCSSVDPPRDCTSSIRPQHPSAHQKPSMVDTLGTGGGTASSHSAIPTRPAWSWEQRFDGRPARSVFGRVADYVLEFLNIRPFLIHKERDGNLWVWVKEVDGHHLEVVMPGSGRA